MQHTRQLNEQELESVTGGGSLVAAAPETGVKCPQCGSPRIQMKLSNTEEGAGLRVYRCEKCEYLWTP